MNLDVRSDFHSRVAATIPRDSRTTGPGSNAPPEGQASSFAEWRRAAVPCALLLCVAAYSFAPASRPSQLLSYQDLVNLYEQDPPSPKLQAKLTNLLDKPFIENNARSGLRKILSPGPEQIVQTLHVAQWNIERGVNFDAVAAALQGPDVFPKVITASPGKNLTADLREKALNQSRILSQSDVIFLNEVDWGLKRSGYHNVAKELANTLHMNYAYGVEFVEVDPITLDIENLSADGENDPEIAKNLKLDQSRTLGLHGNAILSRFPLRNVRIYRFKTQGHDWYHAERNAISRIEKLKRVAGDKVFLEKVFREVRRGGRMMLLADIDDPSSPGKSITLVDAHLEARTKPKNRVAQEAEILEEIKGVDHPVILAGDMNTTGKDSTPTSIRDEVLKRLGSTTFWVKKAISWSTGMGMVIDASTGLVSFYRTYTDPTVRHFHIISENSEAKFFSKLEKFRFEDGARFDFRGDKEHSANGRARKLANSNERNGKGFVETFELTRSFVVLKYKLDWVFVKPAGVVEKGRDDYLYAPSNGQTLKELNYCLEDRISDHTPITADVLLGQRNVKRLPAGAGF